MPSFSRESACEPTMRHCRWRRLVGRRSPRHCPPPLHRDLFAWRVTGQAIVDAGQPWAARTPLPASPETDVHRVCSGSSPPIQLEHRSTRTVMTHALPCMPIGLCRRMDVENVLPDEPDVTGCPAAPGPLVHQFFFRRLSPALSQGVTVADRIHSKLRRLC